MGADSEGDEGLELSEDSEDSKEEEEDEVDVVAADGILEMADGVFVVGDGMLDVEQALVEELAAGVGGRTQSRALTPTNFVDVMLVSRSWHRKSFISPRCDPYKSTTQQSAKGAVLNAPLYETQPSAEGGVINVPLYQPHYAQMLFMPDMMTHPQQQLYLHRDFTAPALGVVAQQQHAAQEPGRFLLNSSMLLSNRVWFLLSSSPHNLLLSNQLRRRRKKF
jgi:hypothetical protein